MVSWSLLIDWGQGREWLISVSGPMSARASFCLFPEGAVHGVCCFHGPRAKTQPKVKTNSVSVVNRPKPLFLKYFDAHQNLMP